MNAVAREYHHLKVGTEKSPQFAAWGARNLLELKIITAYVLVSKKKADRFINDMVPDGIEFFEAVESQQKRGASEADIPFNPAPVQQTLLNLRAEKARLGLPANAKHLEIHNVAETVNLLPEYKDVNRICSKLVHRTAFSVLGFDATEELAANLAPMMFYVGARYGLQVWDMLTRHIAVHGMEPAGSPSPSPPG